ncbi:putative MATE family efflux protein [Fusobacterium sp. PH5-7]|uniref:MATE family efflux transporter n=1 Tax=Fusobacterium sp. PH5-7 TaxID=2940528 RepID=UPI001E1352D1|nr:MATE family efflux transporter [Fusobacterium sp. PH5-7]MDH6458635.1 putative MATE family efflux protein [Fusobacterium sp. PH5-7]HJH07537.1 MATE family efflux transporter [Fusobacterium ulcerans]
MKKMTEGNVTKNIFFFTIPIFLGNIFQQMYNTADAVIVGRFSGKEALAAVGTAGPIMNILIFFVVGFSLGSAILMAEFYGAEDIEKLKKEIATTIKAGAVFIFLLSAVALFSVKYILILMNTPIEIMEMAEGYLRIIIIGLIFSFLYNILSAEMRAVGDSKTPLGILVIAVVLNIGLDIYFIKNLGMGVKGAAYATVISQIVAVVISLLNIYFRMPVLRLTLKEFVIDLTLLKKTMSYSLSYAVQQTIIFTGAVFVQGAVNPLGIDSIAAFNSGSRIDGFILTPGDSMGAALTTFISQNRGAGKDERIFKGFKSALTMSLLYCVATAILIFIFSGSIMKIFIESSETEAIFLGRTYLKTIAFFYILTALCNTLQGFFRGFGRMDVTLIATFIQIPIRVVLSYMLTKYMGISGVAVGMGIGWIFMASYEGYLYMRYRNRRRELNGVHI